MWLDIYRMEISWCAVLVFPLLITRTESSGLRWSHFSHQLPGQGSMMSVTRSFHSRLKYPGHSVSDNDTYKETLNHRDANDDKTIYHDLDSRPGPFAPRFRVPRWEISDEEWSQEIEEGFSNTGIVPEILPHPPSGLININFGVHSCIHMGNLLSYSETRKEPQLSWPTLAGRLYSLVMLETETMALHWMKVNISRSDMTSGETVVRYHPPPPGQFLMVALLQNGVRGPEVLSPYTDTSCLHRINFSRVLHHLGSELVVAANYWRQEDLLDQPEPELRESNQVCQSD